MSDSRILSAAACTNCPIPCVTNGATNAAFGGSASATFFSRSAPSVSRSWIRSASASWMSASCASGATVSTYWSVSRSVLWVQTASSEMGARMHTRTTSTPHVMRRQRGTACAVSVVVAGVPASLMAGILALLAVWRGDPALPPVRERHERLIGKARRDLVDVVGPRMVVGVSVGRPDGVGQRGRLGWRQPLAVIGVSASGASSAIAESLHARDSARVRRDRGSPRRIDPARRCRRDARVAHRSAGCAGLRGRGPRRTLRDDRSGAPGCHVRVGGGDRAGIGVPEARAFRRAPAPVRRHRRARDRGGAVLPRRRQRGPGARARGVPRRSR